MDKDQQLFTPESVDDEIDRLINKNSFISSNPNTQLTHELCHIYIEDADSLKQVWERLERYSIQQLSSHTSQRPYTRIAQKLTVGHHILSFKKRNSSTKYPASQLFTVLTATIIGVFLVGSLAWTLAITHAPAPGTTRPGSSSTSVTPTSQAPNATATQSNIQPRLMTGIRMLDTMNGWALTSYAILKTSDGGVHWQDVTPANAAPSRMSKGDFMNAQDAWVVTPQETQSSISILYTTNGGKSWQNSTIHNTVAAATDMPHFLNISDGWLQTFGEPGAGNLPSAIFHTTDGGQHWYQQLQNTYQGSVVRASGISFSDTQNGWKSGDGGAAVNPSQPLLDVTHDGGQTWHKVQLPILPGAGKDDIVETTPPVLFGNNGLLPVEDDNFMPPGRTSYADIGLDLYVTHDGGQTWTPTNFITINADKETNPFTVYAADMRHVWAASGTDLYATNDGGQSWTKLPSTPENVNALSFIDADNGWAIATTSNMYNPQPELLHTTDGGHTWLPIHYSIQ